MNINVSEILKKRLAHDQAATTWPAKGLRLACDGATPLGDLITPMGYAHRELARAESHPRYKRALAGGVEGATHLAMLEILKGDWRGEDESARWRVNAIKELNLPLRVREAAMNSAAKSEFYEQTADLSNAYARVLDHPYALEDTGEDVEPRHRTLGIFGAVGCGKTVLSAVWLLSGVRDSGDPGLFIKARDLVEDVSRDSREVTRLASVPRLVIDGIGAESEDLKRPSVRALTRVLDARSDADVLTCFTTSCTVPELRKAFGDYGYSRLMDRGLGIVLSGSDRRLQG